MKFKVTMKDTDTLNDAIDDAVKRDIASMANLDDEEKEAITDLRREKVGNLCSQWFRYSEYLTVEIDTETGTIRVCGKDE